MKRFPPLLKVVVASSVLAVLVAGSIITFLQSNWIPLHIQQAVVAGVEDATGAHVEIPSVTWNWRALTFEMRGFTMHGSEPASGPPLFISPLIRVRLRILSLLNQQVQLSSLVVTNPRFYLMIEPDGKTNIPGPKRIISAQDIINTLIDLQLPHVEATGGWAQINRRSFPVNLVGDRVSVLIRFQKAAREYRLALRSPSLRLGNDRSTYFDGSVDAKGDLWRDHFSLSASHFHSRTADFKVSGSVFAFNNPVVDWTLASTFSTTETMRDLGIKGLANGNVVLNGVGHHDPQNPLFFDGQITADHFSAAYSDYRLRDSVVRSRVIVDRASVKLSDLSISSAQGRFSGGATLVAYRDLTLSGVLSGIDLKSTASQVIHKPFPWSATLSGPIAITATIGPLLENLAVQGKLALQPRSEGIPVSGDLSYEYRQRDSNLLIAESHLNLPNTQVSVSGQPNANVLFSLDTTNLADLSPGLSLMNVPTIESGKVSLVLGGGAHLRGTARLGTLRAAQVDGTVEVSRIQWRGLFADHMRAAFNVSSNHFQISSLSLESPLLQSSVAVQVALNDWKPSMSSSFQASGSFSRARVQALINLIQPSLSQQVTGGYASGSFNFHGALADPAGDAEVNIASPTIHAEQLDVLRASLKLRRNRLDFSQGRIQAGTATLSFAGAYTFESRAPDVGELQLSLESNRFPLSLVHSFSPSLNNLEGQTEIHIKTAVSIQPSHVAPLNLSGTLSLHHLLYKGELLGDLDATAVTEGRTVKAGLSGNLRGSRLTGTGNFQIAPGTPTSGSISFEPVNLRTVLAILQPAHPSSTLLSGSAGGRVEFNGPLETPNRLHAVLQLVGLQITGPPLRNLSEEFDKPAEAPETANEVILQSSQPITIELTDGIAVIRSAQFAGRDTSLKVSGTTGLLGTQPVHLLLNGATDLRLLQLLYPDLQIGGRSEINAAVSGTLSEPQLAGSLHLIDASIASPFVPNSLSNLGGTIRFDQHRATLENVTAHTGGGLVRFGGFVTYTASYPLVYRLESTGQNIRVRYANGISITGNSQFSLTGTSEQSLLSGSVTVSRVVLNPSADLGNLLALTAAPAVASDTSKDYLSKLQMDIHVESAPNLQLDTALSNNVQAELDLQLHGTPKQPVILGNIEADQGDIKVFGSRYTINRGQVSFTNAARLEPVLDLDLQTQARGITVDITVSGTLNKLNINYRSDPPLQPRDIIALLTVGRTPQTTSGDSNVSATNDANSLQSGANSVLGQAIAPVSNRLSKLFGITNIKIDPLVQGITNTPQARLTLEQQISRQITVTYITNLSQTSEQIFRLEYSLNPQFSLVALRDDNGEFGIDILYKKRFK